MGRRIAESMNDDVEPMECPPHPQSYGGTGKGTGADWAIWVRGTAPIPSYRLPAPVSAPEVR